jgi:hypothetical protein
LASIINASNSGFGGIVSTGDSSGVLQLQAAGTTIATIQSTGLNLGSNGVVFSDSSSQTAAASPYVLKNRIINGDMRIDQRNAGASVTPTDGQYVVDRFFAGLTQASKFSLQQSTDAPTGFVNSLKATSLSAYSVGASDTFLISQNIEGLNCSDLAWGTASAKTVTLSFWVKSSLTGTFGGTLKNSAANRSYPFSYTISTANTWEQKSVTIAGDTSGTWLTTNDIGVRVIFGLGGGSTFSGTAGAWTAGNLSQVTGGTSVVGTNGATWYLTGAQLEQNTSATPFERRLYNQELANCYRYYQQLNFGAAIGASGMGLTATKYAGADSALANAQLLAPMRTTPTITKSQSTARFVNSGGIGDLTAVVAGTFGLNGPIYISGTNNAIPAGSNGWIDQIGSIYITAEL